MESENITNKTGRAYWRSIDELTATPEFDEWLHREFPAGASEIEGVDRRKFLKVMGASFSLAGLGMAGCRRPKMHVLPYAKQPEHVIPGVPNFYSTSVPGTWGNIPVIVESHQSRPTKIEGNPSYKHYNGSTDVFTQASILNLYDPDRLRQSMKDGKRLKVTEVLDELDVINSQLTDSAGKGFAVLAEPSIAPSRSRLIAEMQAKFPEMVWAEYSSLNNQGLEAATLEHMGKRVRAHYKLDAAKRILALDSDFLQSEPNALCNAKGFAKGRKVRKTAEAKKMNRLYAVESNLTVTGSNADHRLRLASSDVAGFTALVAVEILSATGGASDLIEVLKKQSAHLADHAKWAKECAADLLENKGHSLVIPGSHLGQEVQLLAGLINSLIGAAGATVTYVEIPLTYTAATLEELVEKMNAGEVQTLLVLGGNPAYNKPGSVDWEAATGNVENLIRVGDQFDETCESAQLSIARSHYLESWADGYSYEGQYLPVQPLIEPLFDTIAENEILARIAGAEEKDPYKIIRQTASAIVPDLADDRQFSVLLAEGLWEKAAFAETELAVDTAIIVELYTALSEASELGIKNLEIRVTPSNNTLDGSFNNNGWMMECPDPLTKLTWDNAILISPRLAKELEESQDLEIFPGESPLNQSGQGNALKQIGEIQRNKSIFKRGKEEAPVAELTIDGKTIKGPLHVLPGLANYTVVLSQGFGRRITGRIGTGAGFDVFPLVDAGSPAYRTGVSIKITGEIYPLANTQEHWSIEGRAILREATTEDYSHNPDYVKKIGIEAHSPPIYGKAKDKPLSYKVTETPRGQAMYDTPEFTAPQQWGMTIDLNTCTGCNACVVACQSENNIPIVGKDQVRRGREMHWIRLDRYFSSEDNDKTDIPEDVQVSFQGMACTHCENAPCETVCPVNATVHDEQGLNVMAYNRCVGTRYCANNCPYKVRRFNFFDWHKREIGKFYQGPLGPVDEPQTEQMLHNPDVTVRMRGVMEKCTYCVQRIEGAKIRQKSIAQDSPNVKVPDGTIKTACQQVCPTQAIEFGDLADESTEVYKAKESDLNYSVLGYLNVRPRTTYLAKLRNPNPKMPDAYKQPYTRLDYEDRYGHGGHHDEHAADHSEETHATAHH